MITIFRLFGRACFHYETSTKKIFVKHLFYHLDIKEYPTIKHAPLDFVYAVRPSNLVVFCSMVKLLGKKNMEKFSVSIQDSYFCSHLF